MLSLQEALSRAYQHWNAGQAAQAELLCQRVLAVVPGQADALHLLGLMAHAYGKADLAIAYLRQACQSPRVPASYLSNLAEICRQQGQLAEAETAARRAVAADTRMPGAWNNLGIILQERGVLDESRACLERSLALQPDSPDILNNLANTCQRLGQMAKAEQYWLQALALRPSYAEPHSNLAFLLNARGDHAAALEHARQAVDINPQFADAYVNAAAAEIGNGQPAMALRWLDALLAFAPQHATGLAARAKALLQLDQADAALDMARQAVAVAPDHAEAQDTLGLCLQDHGLMEDALAAFAKAAAIAGPVREAAAIHHASLLLRAGRTAEARASFASLLAEYPNSAQAWQAGAELHRFTLADPAIRRMADMLAQDGALPRSQQVLLHFALARASFDTGAAEQAFQHLEAGNRLQRATLHYDPDATEALMARIAGSFDAALLARCAGAAAQGSQAVFILGMPRAGTALLERVLCTHPASRGAGPLPHIQRLANTVPGYPEGIASLGAGAIQALGNAYLARLPPMAPGQSHVIDRTPLNFLHAGLIHLALPGARIIHCQRDPVDTCLSCYAQLFPAGHAFTYDLVELGRFHRACQGLMAHWRAVLPASHFLDISYEDVVGDPDAQARRMLEFLGLPWAPQRLGCPVGQAAGGSPIGQLVHAGRVGQGRRHAGHLGPLLQALGIVA